MNWEMLLYAPVGELLWKKKQDLHRRATSKPAIGATICCSGMRMSVQAGLSDDLWHWLVSRMARAGVGRESVATQTAVDDPRDQVV